MLKPHADFHRAMRHPASHLALALALAVVLPGCLGSVSPASIPAATLQANDWHQARESRESRAAGLVDIVSRDYAPVEERTALGSGVSVVSVTNVPILDEKRFIPAAVERIEKDRGVQFNEVGSRVVELTNIGRTTGTEYTISGASLPGRALLLTPDCGDFIVLVAWGATTIGPAALISGRDRDLYEEAIGVAKAVEC